MGNNSYNPYVSAQTQFDNVAEKINLEQSICELLRQPSREYHLQFSKDGRWYYKDI